ncbi:MAG: hypothetical protein M0P71_06730 [Melioribacteraceae bacterium]|nr:hypothetical protein [Melioribacteraceae bacterium]
MNKNFFFLLLFFTCISVSGQTVYKFGEAKGLFMAVGVGPRFPINEFAKSQNLGIGFDVTFSYTDNAILPVFFYTGIGFQHNPGKQDFYKKSDYSSLSTNILYLNSGARYYFPPLIENIILLMPIVDVGVNFGLFEKLHQFKLERNKANFVEEVIKGGAHVGVGFSMFLLDVVTYYNYYPNNEYISFSLKANIPIFIRI